jgi:hypothetical protein
MKLNIVYKKEKEWFIGHIQEYPDYESQGETVDELKDNLIEIYNDINSGLVPDAEPFQLFLHLPQSPIPNPKSKNFPHPSPSLPFQRFPFRIPADAIT